MSAHRYNLSLVVWKRNCAHVPLPAQIVSLLAEFFRPPAMECRVESNHLLINEKDSGLDVCRLFVGDVHGGNPYNNTSTRGHQRAWYL